MGSKQYGGIIKSAFTGLYQILTKSCNKKKTEIPGIFEFYTLIFKSVEDDVDEIEGHIGKTELDEFTYESQV